MTKTNEHDKTAVRLTEILTILQHRIVQFEYKEKTYRAESYKLVNHKAIWYLAAKIER